MTHPHRSFDQHGVELAVHQLLRAAGFDDANPDTRDALGDTPARVAKALKESLSGYDVNVMELLTKSFAVAHDEIVLVKDIEFHSMCEHHLLGFHGVAHVAYVPNPKRGVIGLSKLARLVDAFARRLQVQERMSKQIADALDTHVLSLGTAVVVEAQHSCMCARGVRKNATTVTSVMTGCFRDPAKPEARAEVLSLIFRGRGR